jgi:hypothetical protein
MLSSRPELSEAMHREGARALKAFGYLPTSAVYGPSQRFVRLRRHGSMS